MKRFRISMALAFLLLPLAARAQLTTVSGTVTDPNGIPYAFGTISPTLVISGSPQFTSTNLPYAPPSQAIGLDVQGSFTVNLADVTQLSPSGGLWNFHICSAAGTVQPSGGKGPVCFDLLAQTISGSSQSLTSAISAVPPPALTFSGGGGGAVSSVSNSDGTLTISPTTGAVVASLNLAHPNTWTGLQTFGTHWSGSLAGLTFGSTSDSVLGVTTAATTPSLLALPSCAGASNALTYTLGTGFGCNSISGGGTVTGSGTANIIPIWTSASALGNSPLSVSGGVLSSSDPFFVSLTSSGNIPVHTLTTTAPCAGGSAGWNQQPGCDGALFVLATTNTIAASLAAGLYGEAANNGSQSSGHPYIVGVFGTGTDQTTSTNLEPGWVAGLAGTTFAQGTGTLPGLSAVVGSVYMQGISTVSIADAFDATVSSSQGGTVTKAAGLYVHSPVITGTGATYGLLAGVYIEDQTPAGTGSNANPYGIFEAGTAKNQFGGQILATEPTGSVWGSATGGAKGAGTINATGLFVNGTAVGTGSGSVTNVATGTGLTGGPITTTGTIALTVPVSVVNGGSGQTSALVQGQAIVSASTSAMTSTAAIVDNTEGGGSGVTVAGPFTCGTSTSGCAFQFGASAFPAADLTLGAFSPTAVGAFGFRPTANDASNSLWLVNSFGTFQLAELNRAQTFSSVQTFSATGAIVLSAMSGTNCLEEISGVVTAFAGGCGSGISGLTTNGVVAAASSTSIATPAGSHVTLAASNLVTDSTVTVDLEGPVAIGIGTAPANFVLNASNSFGGSVALSPGSASGTDTATFPDNTGTVAELNLAQTWSGGQTFGNSGIILTGSGAGKTTFTSSNSSSTNYTLTLPANTGTAAELNLAQTWTALQTFGSNASIAGTAHGVLVSENTAAAVATAAGAAGTVLQGAGGSTDPSFVSSLQLGATGTTGLLCLAGATAGVCANITTGAAGLTVILPTGTTTNPAQNYVSNNSNSGWIGNGTGGSEWVSSGTVTALLGANGYATTNGLSYAFNRTGSRELGLDDESAATGGVVAGIGSSANGNEGGLFRDANVCRITSDVSLTVNTANSFCSYSVGGTARAWGFVCDILWTISAGSGTNTFALGVNASQTPTGTTNAGATILTTLTGTETLGTAAISASGATNVLTGATYTPAATIETARIYGTVLTSATAGTFAITATANGTTATAAVKAGSQCTLN